MSPDDPTSQVPPRGPDELDRLLKEALQPTAVAPPLPWATLRARAALEAEAAREPVPAPAGAGAANAPQFGAAGFKHAKVLAGAMLIGALVLVWTAQSGRPLEAPAPDVSWRGDAAEGARWVTERPLEQALGLAQELRSLGAEVRVTPVEAEVALRVQVPDPSRRTAVNQRLAAWELALDLNGALDLRVVAPATPASR